MGVFASGAGDFLFDDVPARDPSTLENRLVVVRSGEREIAAGRLIGAPRRGFALQLETETGRISIIGANRAPREPRR